MDVQKRAHPFLYTLIIKDSQSKNRKDQISWKMLNLKNVKQTKMEL